MRGKKGNRSEEKGPRQAIAQNARSWASVNFADALETERDEVKKKGSEIFHPSSNKSKLPQKSPGELFKDATPLKETDDGRSERGARKKGFKTFADEKRNRNNRSFRRLGGESSGGA